MPLMPATTMDNLDAKVRALLHEAESEEETAAAVDHTFAQRAESYYQKRPHLLSLLRHLHSAYLSLLLNSSNRRHQHKLSLPSVATAAPHDAATDDDTTLFSSSPSSSLNGFEGSSSSFSTSSSTYFTGGIQAWAPPLSSFHDNPGFHELGCCGGGRNDNNHNHNNDEDDQLVIDAVVTEIVMKGVDCDLVSHELSLSRTRMESSEKRCELQGSLLELLESERVMLDRDNARLRWKAAMLAEEGNALREEGAFLRRRVSELAGSLMRVRTDEGRVTVALSKRIEDLQRQIYALERWNKVEVVVKEERRRNNIKRREQVDLCSNCCSKKSGSGGSDGGGNGRFGERVAKWWEKMKELDVYLCVPSYSSFSST